jgi:hypothetical protein
MLEFLKESTFRASDVLLRGLAILKKHYISIAGLCFLLFITYNLSAFLAVYMANSMNLVKQLMFLLFVVLFFSLQLALIKRAILLAQGIEQTSLMNYIPKTKQFLNFIVGLMLYSVLIGIVYLLCSIVAWPLLYLGVPMETISYEINPFLTGIVMMLILVRISFFPFFILVNNFNIFRACRMSVAFTKGNVANLLVLIFGLAFMHILQVTFEYFEYNVLAKISSVLNTFIVIPLVSLVMAIAYVDMLREYKGSDDPALFKNII